MNKRNLKLIMELIFIFILPLLFICFTSEIQIERNYEYDNNGNYETSIENKNLSFDNSIVKYIGNEGQYKTNLIFNQQFKATKYNSTDYEYTFNGIYSFEQIGYMNIPNINHKYAVNVSCSSLSTSNGLIYFRNALSNNYNLNIVNGGTDVYFINNFGTTELLLYITSYNNYEYSNYNLKVNVIDLTLMFGSGYEPTNIVQLANYINLSDFKQKTNEEIITIYGNSIISEYSRLNYTIWGNIKQLLITNLDLNNNVLIDIVLCYMILWVINWIIWHIFYEFLELLIHIIPRKRERD